MTAFADFERKTALPFRNAFADWSHVPTRLAWEGTVSEQPVATIAITTFRRADFLVEAVQSAREQVFDRAYEVIIVDNDPESKGPEALLERLPGLRGESFRYFVNQQNFGVMGNFNRCIELARGEWITILNDDDLLDPTFLALMFTEIDRHSGIEGIASRKRYLDQTPGRVVAPGDTRTQAGTKSFYRRARAFARKHKLRLRDEYLFLAQTSRRLSPRMFFWDALLGNGGGFLFRREPAMVMGGYYPEEFPSADYWFYTRFAALFHLRQHRAEACTIRVTGENLMTPTALATLERGVQLQTALARRIVPESWMRHVPLIVACARQGLNIYWNASLTEAEVEDAVGLRLAKPDGRRLASLRLRHRVN